jgi:hypothetical protein
MSKYKPLYSNLWNDPEFENFTVEQKLIFIFLITNSAVEKSGIYKITIKQISFYTDTEKEVINEFINKLINLGKIKYDFENGIIFIKNVFKFQKGMIKNKKIMFICLLKNYQMVKTEFWQDFFSLYSNDEIINEFINENINKEIKDLIINKKSNEIKKTKTQTAVNEECKSELINHNQNINVDFQEFWKNYPLQKTEVKGSKAISEKKYNLLRKKGISKEELSNALAKYQEEIKTNSWQQTKRAEFWLTKWEAYRQEDYSKELKFIESGVKKIEPLASIQVKDKNIIIKLPTFDSFRLNKEIINKNLGMLCENIGYKMQLIN